MESRLFASIANSRLVTSHCWLMTDDRRLATDD